MATGRLSRTSTSLLAVKAPHASGYPSAAHVTAAIRYFDDRYGPLQHAQAPRDPTSKQLRQTLFVRLPSDRAREAIKAGRHAIPLPNERLRGFIDKPARDFRTTLEDCLPERAVRTDTRIAFDVRVALAEDRTAAEDSPRRSREDEEFAQLWTRCGRFAPRLAQPASVKA